MILYYVWVRTQYLKNCCVMDRDLMRQGQGAGKQRGSSVKFGKFSNKGESAREKMRDVLLGGVVVGRGWVMDVTSGNSE